MVAEFKIIRYGGKAWKEAVLLREKILRIPLGTQFTAAELEEERDHYQIVGYIRNELIATAVLVPEAECMKMQRVVVSDKFRSMKIGSEMMLYCESVALELGYHSVYCHARDSAIRFYKKNGYTAEGDLFDEDGIPHLKMTRILK